MQDNAWKEMPGIPERASASRQWEELPGVQSKYGGSPWGCNASWAEVEEGTSRMTEEGRCWEYRKELGGCEADGEELSKSFQRGNRTGRGHR